MTKRYMIAILFIFLCACQSNSTQQSLSCEQILEEELRALTFDEMTAHSFPEWVSSTYSLDRREVIPLVYDERLEGYTDGVLWRFNSKLYSGSFVHDELQHVRVEWNQTAKPTAGEVIDCFGPPSEYSAIYHELRAEIPVLELYLWYSGKGIIIIAGTHGQAMDPPSIHEDIGVLEIIVTRPGTVQEMLHRGEANAAPDLQQAILQASRPWPGTWEELEILRR
jgi:hypothetical protein